MGSIHRLGLVAAMVSVLYGSLMAPRASADEATAVPIVYSSAYLKLIAAFPAGWADECSIGFVLSDGVAVVCADSWADPVYFYPDGTLGSMPWVVDRSSPTGWSVEPDPCAALTDDENQRWSNYVDFTNGYLDTGPSLTDEQIELYGACWGWWF
jgi:hypothetical protein